LVLEKLATVEVKWEEGARQLNECEYLFIRNIGELEELTLGLIIHEAKPQDPILVPEDDSAFARISVGSRPIEEDSTCRVFEVIFDRNNIVSYTVLNESYGKYPEPPEEFIGRLFRVFSRSHLLDFTKQTTIASNEYPGVLQHYQLACLNHVVDVITTKPPRIAVGIWSGESRP
jgi:hypothetical protein